MARNDPYNTETPIYGGIERYKVKPAKARKAKTPKKSSRKTKRSAPRGKGMGARRGM